MSVSTLEKVRYDPCVECRLGPFESVDRHASIEKKEKGAQFFVDQLSMFQLHIIKYRFSSNDAHETILLPSDKTAPDAMNKPACGLVE
jgi:hypothetical protein